MEKSLTLLLAILLAFQTFAATINSGAAPTQQSGLSFTIDSHSNKCYQNQIKVNGGHIIISFSYKVLSNQNLMKSAVFVLVDKNPIDKVTPLDSGNNIKLKGKLSPGKHILSFCPRGDTKEPQHQVSISNIMISKALNTSNLGASNSGASNANKKCVPGFGKDLIINGGFEETVCVNSECYWTSQTFKPNFLAGWSLDDAMEIGKNSFLAPGKRFGSNYVALIQGLKKISIKQNVPLTIGKYQLKFDWMSRNSTIIGKPTFQVKYNGKSIKNIPLVADQSRSESVQFALDRDAQNGELAFSIDSYTSYGVLLDNVSLQKFQNCPNSRTPRF